MVEAFFDTSTGVFTCNKTWEEINQSAFAVIVADFSGIGDYDVQIFRFIVSETYVSNGAYNVTTVSGEYDNGQYAAITPWSANSASDYPKFEL